MCNPRRVQVTATRQLNQAWEREVERVAEVAATLTGTARIRQPLDATLGGSALLALQNALAQGFPGWTEQPDGSFHSAVDGGYVAYHPDDHTLEIVATLTEELRVQGSARERLSGTVSDTVEVQSEGQYYDDGWANRTRERALDEARRGAETALDRAVQSRLEVAATSAEQQQTEHLQQRAQQVAQQHWETQAAARRSELAQQAAAELTRVGIRARHAFHQLLAHAYREALLSLARRRGVSPDTIIRRENDDYLEIEFMLPD
jgi:hypothetical protein